MTMDPLGSAIQSKLVPYREHLLQGSIKDSCVENLIQRLKGLCDDTEHSPAQFRDHEMCFVLRGSRQLNKSVTFYARHSLDRPDLPWHARYISPADISDKCKHTLVRNCVDAATSDNLVQFLKELGFHLDFEYVVRGFLFKKGLLKVTLSKICKILNPEDYNNVEPHTASHLVELSVLSCTDNEKLSEEIKTFAEQLRPLVQLSAIDHRKLVQGGTWPNQ